MPAKTGNEIAHVYVSVIPETSKIAPGIKSAFKGVDATAEKTGKSMGNRLTSAVGKTFKAGAIGIGAAAGAALGGSLAKGLGRLSAIENAQAKLRGLGNSANDVSQIMDNALASVKGTSFGLGEAATTAAGAVVAGIAPGRELENVLKAVANTAAASGTSMEEMGAIYNKVASFGKAQNDVLQQVASRGIPIYEALAKQMNVTSEEVFKLASDGSINFETFQKAMTEAGGTVAKELGQTTTGSIENAAAAMGRFGEKLAAPVFASAPAIIGGVTSVFDGLTDAIAPASERIGEVLAPALASVSKKMETTLAPAVARGAEEFGKIAVAFTEAAVDPQLWERIGSTFSSIGDVVADLWPSVKSLASAFVRVTTSFSIATWQAFGAVVGALAPVLEHTLVPVLNTIADVAEGHPGLVKAMVAAWLGFKGINAAIVPLKNVGGAVRFVSGVLTAGGGPGAAILKFAASASSANPIIAKIGSAFVGLGKNLIKVGNVTQVLAPLASALKAGLSLVNPWVAGFAALSAAAVWFFTKTEVGQRIFQAATDALKAAWESTVNALKAGWDAITSVFSTAWEWLNSSVFEPIKTAFEGLKALFLEGEFTSALRDAFGWEEDSPIVGVLLKVRDVAIAVKDGVVATWAMLQSKWTEFTTGLGQFYETWIQPLVTLGATIGEAIGTAVGWVSEKLGALFTWIGEKLGNAAGWVSEKLGTVYEAVVSVFTSVLDWIKGRFSQMQEVFQPFADSARDIFRLVGSIIQDVWEGTVKSIFDAWKLAASLLGNAMQTAGNIIKLAWNALGQAVQSVWNNIIKPPLNFFRQLGGLLADVLTGNFQNIGNRFREMGAALKATVTGPINAAFDLFKIAANLAKDSFNVFRAGVGQATNKIKGYISDLAANFRGLPGKIKAAFSGAGTWLVEAGKSIIRGLANGIRSAGSMVADAIRAVVPDSLERFVPGLHFGGIIPAFARGGVLPDIPGVSRTQRDPILGWSADQKVPVARVEPGEFIVNREQTKRHLPLLAAINAGRVNPKMGDLGGFANLPGYAKGGVVGYQDLLSFFRGQRVNGQQASRSLEGAPYVFGGSNWGDCSSTQGQGALFTVGKQATRGRFMATGDAAQKLSSIGFRRGRSPRKNAYEIGFYNGGPGGGHAVGTLFDSAGRSLNVEMGGARGNGQIGGRAAGTSGGQYTGRYWHPLKGGSTTGSNAPRNRSTWGPPFFVGEIVRKSEDMKLDGLAAKIGVATALVESGDPLKMYANRSVPESLKYRHDAVGSDHDSVGLFQQRNNGAWGTVKQRMTPYDSAGMFFRKLKSFDYRKMDPGAAAQKVQASAFPDRYGKKMGRAQALIKQYGSTGVSAQAETLAGGGVESTSSSGITLTGGEQIDWGEASNLYSEIKRERDLAKKLARWRRGAFDRGGIARGIGFMPKATIKPERVLNPSNTKAFDQLPGALADVANKLGISAEAQGMAARAMSNVEAAITSFNAKDAIKLGDMLGLEKITGVFKGSVTAYDEMQTAHAAQVDAADGVKQAEKNLATARREYAEALAEDTELTVKQKRKLEDAQAAVVAAKKPDKKGNVNADKVAKAELRLKRVQEDIAAEQEKTGKKQSDKVKEAAENLTKAEDELAAARYVVTAAAKAAGFAEIGMVLAVAEIVGKVAKKIGTAIRAARQGMADARAESMKAVSEWTQLVDSQRETVSKLKMSLIDAQIALTSAAWKTRLSVADVIRAQLEGAKNVAEAEAKLKAERERVARAGMLHYNDMRAAYDRFRLAERDAMAGRLDDFIRITPEIRALEHEVNVARIEGIQGQHKAVLASLEAMHAQQLAALDLASTTLQLQQQTAQLAQMAQTHFGLTSEQALTGANTAALEAEALRLRGKTNRGIGWVGDFLTDPIETLRYAFGGARADKARLKQLEAQIAERNAAGLGTGVELDPKIARQAQMLFGRGLEEEARNLLASSSWGDAQRALDAAKEQQQILGMRQAEEALKASKERLQALVDFETKANPLRQQLDALESAASAEKHRAEYWREESPAVREALKALADFEASNATDLIAASRGQKTTLNLTIPNQDVYTREQMDAVLNLLTEIPELESRIERIENPPTGANALMNARLGR